MEIPFYKVVQNKLGDAVFSGKTVHEIGCARFAESKALSNSGAKVVALDVLKREEPPAGVTFIQSDFLDWMPSESIDILYMSQVVLFMPTEEVFEKITALAPRTIAVRTMSNFPEPNWPPEILKPLWFTTSHDWINAMEKIGYRTVHADMHDVDTPDMRGINRKFHMTEYIGVKMGERAS